MISLEPIRDQWKIKEALTKDQLYLDMYKTDDLYSENVLRDNIAWYLVKDFDKTIGVLLLKEFSNYCVLPHGGIYKEFRGINTLQTIKDILTLIKSIGLKPILTVASKNTKMIKLIQKLGYTSSLSIKEGCPDDDLLIYGENNG